MTCLRSLFQVYVFLGAMNVDMNGRRFVVINTPPLETHALNVLRLISLFRLRITKMRLSKERSR